ncbi:MAG: hypothetical protein M1834_002307 [Cirrosporium novae-zelandiae]|nr:MAG: hypothetical protein M1834_002307 [Cirrosporium novae-zelandiae]
MSSDDQYFLDVLSSIPNDVKRYSSDIAESINDHVESVAITIRETIQNSPWLPSSVKPPRRIHHHPTLTDPISLGPFEHLQNWVSRHRAWAAAVVAFLGTGTFLIYQQRKNYVRKRRARRANNGARREVVVISGSPSEPLVRSIALDLERRGFIVFIVVSTLEEENIVHNESRVDIRPLHLDITDPLGVQSALELFNQLLASSHQPFPGSPTHNLRLTGVIMLPDSNFPCAPVSATTPDRFSDNLNTKLLAPILTTQAFLQTIVEFNARLLILTPSITPSLSLPFHSIETTITSGLVGFTESLRKEVGPLGVQVIHLKLGMFDKPAGRPQRSELLTWSPNIKDQYAQNYASQEGRAKVKGSSMRVLNNAVFDALTLKHPRKVWHVGRGSLTYDFIGRWVPGGIVGWMMGIKTVTVKAESDDDVMPGSESVQWEKVDRLV